MDTSWGQTYRGDGDVFTHSMHVGFANEKGAFADLTFETRDREFTDRAGAWAWPFYQPVDCAPGEAPRSTGFCLDPRESTVDRHVIQLGDPASEHYTAYYNAAVPLADNASLYSFGGVSTRANTSNLSDKDNLFARWSTQQQLRGNRPGLPPTANYGTLVPGGNSTDVTSNNAAFGWNRIWSPTLISNIRLGWNYLDTDVEIHDDVPGNINKEIGLPGFDQDLRGLAILQIGGWQSLGNSNWAPNLIQSQTRQVSVDNTLTRGNHAIKFGAQIYFMQTGIVNPQLSLGIVAFPRQFTRDMPIGGGATASRTSCWARPTACAAPTPST